MKPDTFPEQTPKFYAISVEEFKLSPQKLEPYTPGDKVTRKNFTDFLVRSFAISMGQMKVQGFFLAWLKLKTGFEYSKTLTNFIQAGGYNILSDDEKVEFKRQFSGVGEHKKRWGEEKYHNQIVSGVERIETFVREIPLSPKVLPILKDINTFEDFLKFSQDQIKRLRIEQAQENR